MGMPPGRLIFLERASGSAYLTTRRCFASGFKLAAASGRGDRGEQLMTTTADDLRVGAPIGFVVLSHSEPTLLRRLLRGLDRAYRDPPIVVHHDFSQCALPDDVARWSADLQFVRPH